MAKRCHMDKWRNMTHWHSQSFRCLVKKLDSNLAFHDHIQRYIITYPYHIFAYLYIYISHIHLCQMSVVANSPTYQPFFPKPRKQPWIAMVSMVHPPQPWTYIKGFCPLSVSKPRWLQRSTRQGPGSQLEARGGPASAQLGGRLQAKPALTSEKALEEWDWMAIFYVGTIIIW